MGSSKPMGMVLKGSTRQLGTQVGAERGTARG
jgi:hypothetical protein